MSRRGHRLSDDERERIASAITRMQANNDQLYARLTELFGQLVDVLTHGRPDMKALLERPKETKIH